MAKLKLSPSDENMATFMLCEAIGKERGHLDLKKDENGEYDVKLLLNGQELDFERFCESLSKSYNTALKKQTAELLSREYDNIVDEIQKIQETLREHSVNINADLFGFPDGRANGAEISFKEDEE